MTYAFAGMFAAFIVAAPAVSLWFLLAPIALTISELTLTRVSKHD